MAVPLTLSSVPAQTPYAQYVSGSSQTVFPYPFEITQDSDLVVLLNGVQQATDGGYTVSGQGTTIGGNITFLVGLTAGTIVTVYRNISIARITQLSQNGTFFSSNFNNEYNRIYLILQQIQQSLGGPTANSNIALMVPVGNSPTPTTLLTPTAYANKYLSFDGNGNPQPAVLTSSGSVTASLIAGLLNGTPQTITINVAQTAAEIAATVVPTNAASPTLIALMPQRFGAVGNGVVDDTTALQNWLTVLGESSQQAYGYLPAATYKYSSNLTVPANVNIVGAGKNLSILKPTTGVTQALITGSLVRLRDFCIDLTNVSAATGLVVAPSGNDFNQIQDITIQNFSTGGIGMLVVNSVWLGVTGCMFNGTGGGGGTPVKMLSTSPASGAPTTVTFFDCIFQFSGTNNPGVFIQSGEQIQFNRCIFQTNGGEGIRVQPQSGASSFVQDVSVIDCWFEGNWVGHADTGTHVYDILLDGANGAVNGMLDRCYFSEIGLTGNDERAVGVSHATLSMRACRAYQGYAYSYNILTSDCVVYVLDDTCDRMGRFISNASGASVVYPTYLPVMDLGTGLSVLPTIEKLVGLTYTSSMTPDMKNGNSFNIQVTNTSAFTINNPLNTGGIQIGKRFGIRIINVSSNNTLGTVTFGSLYKTNFATAASSPANNTSLYIEFEWDGVHMVECYHSPANVPV